MNILDLIVREHMRFAADLQRYVDTADPAQARELGFSVLERIDTYLRAEEKTLFPAFAAASRSAAPLPLVHHHQLRRRIADTASHRSRANDTSWLRAMLKLQQETHHFVRKERADLCTALRRVFSAVELKALGEQMLSQLITGRGLAECLGHGNASRSGSRLMDELKK